MPFPSRLLIYFAYCDNLLHAIDNLSSFQAAHTLHDYQSVHALYDFFFGLRYVN